MTEDREEKKKKDLAKKIKTLKIISSVTGLSLPVVVMLLLIFVTAIASLLPIFMMTTMVGGTTAYAESDVVNDLTVNGINIWSKEESQIFEDYKKEKDYYDNAFEVYNAKGIKDDPDDEYDIATMVSTINYRGTTNLLAFDETYEGQDPESKEDNEDNKYNTQYQSETNVENNHTRNFYEQANEATGNTFMIFPGLRMLLGNLVANEVTFDVVEYTGNNSNEIYSNWSYLGKITSSNEEDAKKHYTPSEAVEMIYEAIDIGKKTCGGDGEYTTWERKNICYDLDLLFEEIFHDEFEVESTQDIINFLEEQYGAEFPGDVDELKKRHWYIKVKVRKVQDYELYEKYLKEIYIPYVYIDCADCQYKNESDDVKEKVINRIYDEIIQLTSSFKYYNYADYSEYSEQNIGGGIYNLDYTCDENNRPNIVSYFGHKGLDLNGVPVGTNIYPLFEGVVTSVVSCNQNYPPERNYDSNNEEYYTCNNANSHNCGYGNMVKIKGKASNGIEYYAFYGHLSSINVSVGDTVSMNTVIGTLGNTGCSTGPHLHLELRKVSDNSVTYATAIYTSDAVQSVLCSR